MGKCKDIIKNFEYILQEVDKSKILEKPPTPQDMFSTKSSTAMRVLLSDKYYGDFKSYYELTNMLSSFIYKLYQQGDANNNQLNDKIEIDTDDNGLREFFKKLRSKENYFNNTIWSNAYWQYDDKYGTVRKEGIKLTPQKGRYLEKEKIEDVNLLKGKSYRNAELIHPTHKVHDIDDSEDLFHWIHGAYGSVEDYSIRFYWNFYPNCNILRDFLDSIQVKFDERKIPFSFKFLAKADDYQTHTDVAVLYLPRKHALISFEVVRELYNKVKLAPDFLRNNYPMFTYRLDTGLSFGENPDDRRYTSFGSYRAIYIAMAIVEFYHILRKNKLPTENELYQCLESKNPGWLDKFHVNQFSEYDYQYEIKFFKKEAKTKPFKPTIDSSSFEKRCFWTAANIAYTLSKEAVWYSDGNDSTDNYYPLQPNWVSFVSKTTNESGFDENMNQTNSVDIEYAALDNDFFNGRLGVIFFLHSAFQDQNNEFFKSAYVNTVTGALDSFEGISFWGKELIKKEKDGNWFSFLKSDYIKALNFWRQDTKESKEHKELVNKIEKYFLTNPFDDERIKAKKLAIKKGDKISSFPRNKDAWKDEKHTKLIDNVLTNPDFKLSADDKKTVENMISEYFDKDRPFGNALGSDEFCVTLKDGYAGLGYFFLRLYDKKFYKALPFQITYTDGIKT